MILNNCCEVKKKGIKYTGSRGINLSLLISLPNLLCQTIVDGKMCMCMWGSTQEVLPSSVEKQELKEGVKTGCHLIHFRFSLFTFLIFIRHRKFKLHCREMSWDLYLLR